MELDSLYIQLLKEFDDNVEIYNGKKVIFEFDYHSINPFRTVAPIKECSQLKRKFLDLHTRLKSTIMDWNQSNDSNNKHILDNLLVRKEDTESFLAILDTYLNELQNTSSENNSKIAVVIAIVSIFISLISIFISILSFF